jgi:hypothetical protein
LSARQHIPKYNVPLKEGMRPVPEPEPAETAVVEEPGKDAVKDPQTETVEALPTEKTEQQPVYDEAVFFVGLFTLIFFLVAKVAETSMLFAHA